MLTKLCVGCASWATTSAREETLVPSGGGGGDEVVVVPDPGSPTVGDGPTVGAVLVEGEEEGADGPAVLLTSPKGWVLVLVGVTGGVWLLGPEGMRFVDGDADAEGSAELPTPTVLSPEDLLLFFPVVPPTAPPTTAPTMTRAAIASVSLPLPERQNDLLAAGVAYVSFPA
jgi:hypothetical protein